MQNFKSPGKWVERYWRMSIIICEENFLVELNHYDERPLEEALLFAKDSLSSWFKDHGCPVKGNGVCTLKYKDDILQFYLE